MPPTNSSEPPDRTLPTVESGGALRADLGGSLIEARTVSTRQHHLSAFGACSPRGFETDARAATDDDDTLSRELVHRDPRRIVALVRAVLNRAIVAPWT